MRETIIAGNWKMNKDLKSAKGLTREICSSFNPESKVQLLLGVPFPFLQALHQLTKEHFRLRIAAQNVYPKDSGAYTGEVSAPMLISCGVEFVIIGHSERRSYFHEDDAFVNEKLIYTLKSGLRPILCVGEPLEVRKKGAHEQFVMDQLKECLKDIRPDQLPQLVIAYEPIWAIGTGETAQPEEAQSMHASIRSYLRETFGEKEGDSVSLLYGGSMKPDNADALLGMEDIDGGLIGGASLQAESFMKIYEIAQKA